VFVTADDRFLLDLADGLERIAQPRTRTLLDFVKARNPTLLQYEHVPRMVDVVQRWIDGVHPRLMLLIGPRYFKTEVAGSLSPAYILKEMPTQMVWLVSYGAHLAWDTSTEARAYYREDGGVLGESRAASLWSTSARGEMWAAGTGGPLLGFGYNYGIVDDPLDPAKAHSWTYIRSFRDWWAQKFLSRQEPDAKILFIMQRLGPNDPVDFLWRRELGHDGEDCAPEHWHICLMDEKRSKGKLADYDGPMGLPPTCTLEPDPRPLGAVLAPSRLNEEQVERLHRTMGPYATAAQRQQRPAPPEGDYWKREWFEVYSDADEHAIMDVGWDWDTAYTKNDHNAASAGIQSGRGPGKPQECNVYIMDVDWDWVDFPGLIKLIQSKTGPHYIEDKATGKSAEQTLKANGLKAVKLVQVVGGDKLARANHVQPIVSNRRVYIHERVFRVLLESERQGLLNIRAEDLAAGKGDLDVNDTFVQALNRHTNKRKAGIRAYAVGSSNGAAA